MPASQDFRDGAATGAALMQLRLRRIVSYGVTPNPSIFDEVAAEIRAEYGGVIQISADD